MRPRERPLHKVPENVRDLPDAGGDACAATRAASSATRGSARPARASSAAASAAAHFQDPSGTRSVRRVFDAARNSPTVPAPAPGKRRHLRRPRI